jgi:NAD(P)H-flavin reductase
MLHRSHVLISVYVAINAIWACWTWQSHLEKGADLWVCFAKSSASLIILNNQMLMLSMMRATISRVVYFPLSQLLLFDKHINTHQICGQMFFLSAFIHTLAYLGKAITLNYQLTSNLTGCSLVILGLIFWICAQPRVRRSRCFELFYYSHYLFFPLQMILCFHSRRYCQHMLLPVIGYFLDRAYRFYCTFYPSQILDFKIWSGQILELKISRPKNFNYVPGDYTFICIPEVSKTQWHPFSISSDPHNLNFITIHMKITGNWTTLVEKLCLSYHAQKLTNEFTRNNLVYLDGPLSTPSSTMIQTKHMILVAQGIGITPFISMLKYVNAHPSVVPRVNIYWLLRDQPTADCLQEIFKHETHPKVKINYIIGKTQIDWEHEFNLML